MQCITAYAQHVDYFYDASGNRVSRQYSPSLRLMNPNVIAAKSDTVAQKIAAQYGIKVYPNPTTDGDIVTVAISSTNPQGNETANVSLLDNAGKTLFTQQQGTQSPSQINLSNYAAGIYYVKVMVDKEQLFYQVVKPK